MRSKTLQTCRPRSGFSLLEVMIVVLVLGILAAVVVPRFAGAQAQAKDAALQSALGGVRSSLAAFRTRAVIAGQPPFPTAEQLISPGVVAQGELPVNPFNGLRNVQAVTLVQAQARLVVNEDAFGWNYCVDNDADPPTAIFYANSSTTTEITNSAGSPLNANEL